MSAEDEENAAELKIGEEFMKAKCLMNSEVSQILDRRYQQMAEDPPLVFEKSLQYVKRFSRYKNPESVKQVREILCRYSLSEFELCVVGNLSIETVGEAVAMVPSLRTRDEEAIKKMLDDLSKVKQFD